MKSDTIENRKKEALQNPDLHNLRSYTQIKMALGNLLRTAHQGFITLGRKQAEKQCQELLVKLAEDRFTLAVLGQFKRGKSSLMNAIIGESLLPAGVLPLTSAITILRYGTKRKLIVEKNDSSFPFEFPVESLSDYVTEKRNPQNQKRVKAAYLELPVPFLRYGLEFVDTPGIGSAIAANTGTTYNFLPSCDAALFVTSADTPMTTMELEFLDTIKEYVHKIFFIVNKIDLVGEEDKIEILDFVAKTIQQKAGLEIDKVFAVSSQIFSAGAKNVTASAPRDNGLKALEDALSSFLSEEKAETFLAAIAQKAERIIESEKDDGIFQEEYIQERITTIHAEKLIEIHDDPHEASIDIQKTNEIFSSVYQQIINREKKVSSGIDLTAPITRTGMGSNEDSNAYRKQEKEKPADIKTDLETRGCPVCEHIADKAFDFFAHLQYQISTDEQSQISFASGIAFCPLHTWQLLSLSSPQGASIGYVRLAQEVVNRLKSGNPVDGTQMRTWIHNSSNCPVCKYLREAEHQYVIKLLQSLKEPEGRAWYHHSNSCCLYHLSLMLDNTSDEELRTSLLNYAIEKFEQDAEDMQSFALKSTALRRYLQNENEKDAYLRTIIRVAGERKVCVPWAQDGTL